MTENKNETTFQTKNISVKKIDNGYVIEAYCAGQDQAEYVKSISKVGKILARWFGEKSEPQEVYDSMGREVSESPAEQAGAVNVKIKLTK